MNREINELTQDLRRDDMCEYGGRYLLMMKDGKNLSNGKHMLFWFDPEGNLLEQIPFALEQADETYGLWPVPTESGLWFLYDSRKTHDDIYKEMDSVDMWLVKGPSSLP